MKIKVRVANAHDVNHALTICQKIEESAKIRKTGIAKRDPEYIKKKILEGNAMLAFFNGILAGFSYIETFQEFVANSGMIVFTEFRNKGIAKLIKYKIFKLSSYKFPKYKIFSITTSPTVFKMNMELGFKPVAFTQLTRSYKFWNGCRSCINYDILTLNNRLMCFCSGFLYQPKAY